VVPQVRRFEVTGVESSQFASSLLLGAARVAFTSGLPCAVQVQGALTSGGYLELTRDWVRRAGFGLTEEGGVTTVSSATTPAHLAVPGDWSSLTYLLALAWKSGARVERVDFEAAHPDREIVRHLESIGLRVSREPLVSVTGEARGGLEIDAQLCPDAVPTLAAIAAVLAAPSVVHRVGILRHKESDRLATTRALLAAAGASSTLEGETLTITPGPLHDFAFDALDDHRMAMSSAVLAYLGGVRLTLTGREAVAKSFPGFWTELAKVTA
jgi:3-phosphoshikimate 1-carboxyvinyltransferase